MKHPSAFRQRPPALRSAALRTIVAGLVLTVLATVLVLANPAAGTETPERDAKAAAIAPESESKSESKGAVTAEPPIGYTYIRNQDGDCLGLERAPESTSYAAYVRADTCGGDLTGWLFVPGDGGGYKLQTQNVRANSQDGERMCLERIDAGISPQTLIVECQFAEFEVYYTPDANQLEVVGDGRCIDFVTSTANASGFRLVDCDDEHADVTVDRPNMYAIGDSYTSGEGAYPYLGAASECHRSDRSYSQLMADDLGYSLFFGACSGAVTRDVIGDVGAEGSQYDRESLPQLDLLAPPGGSNPEITHVNIGIGGNDVGFSPVLKACLTSLITDCTRTGPALEFLDKLMVAKPRIRSIIETVAARAPNATIYYFGYPIVAESTGYKRFCAPGLSEYETAFFDTYNRMLNRTYLEAAEEASAGGIDRIHFIDRSQIYTGHGLCNPDSWLNYLRHYLTASMHPKPVGYEATAAVAAGWSCPPLSVSSVCPGVAQPIPPFEANHYPASQEIRWNAVANATSYTIINKDTERVIRRPDQTMAIFHADDAVGNEFRVDLASLAGSYTRLRVQAHNGIYSRTADGLNQDITSEAVIWLEVTGTDQRAKHLLRYRVGGSGMADPRATHVEMQAVFPEDRGVVDTLEISGAGTHSGLESWPFEGVQCFEARLFGSSGEVLGESGVACRHSPFWEIGSTIGIHSLLTSQSTYPDRPPVDVLSVQVHSHISADSAMATFANGPLRDTFAANSEIEVAGNFFSARPAAWDPCDVSTYDNSLINPGLIILRRAPGEDLCSFGGPEDLAQFTFVGDDYEYALLEVLGDVTGSNVLNRMVAHYVGRTLGLDIYCSAVDFQIGEALQAVGEDITPCDTYFDREIPVMAELKFTEVDVPALSDDIYNKTEFGALSTRSNSYTQVPRYYTFDGGPFQVLFYDDGSYLDSDDIAGITLTPTNQTGSDFYAAYSENSRFHLYDMELTGEPLSVPIADCDEDPTSYGTRIECGFDSPDLADQFTMYPGNSYHWLDCIIIQARTHDGALSPINVVCPRAESTASEIDRFDVEGIGPGRGIRVSWAANPATFDLTDHFEVLRWVVDDAGLPEQPAPSGIQVVGEVEVLNDPEFSFVDETAVPGLHYRYGLRDYTPHPITGEFEVVDLIGEGSGVHWGAAHLDNGPDPYFCPPLHRTPDGSVAQNSLQLPTLRWTACGPPDANISYRVLISHEDDPETVFAVATDDLQVDRTQYSAFTAANGQGTYLWRPEARFGSNRWIGLDYDFEFTLDSGATSRPICVNLQQHRPSDRVEEIMWELRPTDPSLTTFHNADAVATPTDVVVDGLNRACFDATALPGAEYELWVKGWDTLSGREIITFPNSRRGLNTSIELREGDTYGRDFGVNFVELGYFVTSWGSGLDQADFNEDGAVNFGDLALFAANWGEMTQNGRRVATTDAESVTPVDLGKPTVMKDGTIVYPVLLTESATPVVRLNVSAGDLPVTITPSGSWQHLDCVMAEKGSDACAIGFSLTHADSSDPIALIAVDASGCKSGQASVSITGSAGDGGRTGCV